MAGGMTAIGKLAVTGIMAAILSNPPAAFNFQKPVEPVPSA